MHPRRPHASPTRMSMVASLAEWCRDVLFGTDMIDSEDQGNGLRVFTAVLLPPSIRTTHSAPFRIFSDDNPSKRGSGR